jgi:hypothetical protein
MTNVGKMYERFVADLFNEMHKQTNVDTIQVKRDVKLEGKSEFNTFFEKGA